MGVFSFVKNIFFPPRCVFCDCFMEPDSHNYFCGKCSDNIEFCFENVCCIKCGKPIESFGKKQLCYFCANEKTKYFNRIISVFVYEKAVKDAVKRFKSKGFFSHTETFAQCMVARITDEYSDINFDFLCGVLPHNTKKSKKKEFDQVQLLCKSLSGKLEIPYMRKLFVRTRETQKQSELHFSERQSNLKNSVAVIPKFDVKEKTVLLIDDVCTTRASIMEYSRALKAAGAKSVYAATVATVKKPK